MQDLEVTFGGPMVAGEDVGGVLGEIFGNHWVECEADGGGDFLAVAGDQSGL